MPKFSNLIKYEEKKIRKAKISNHKWIKTYEEFKGAKLNFYCQFLSTLSSPLVSIGMTHRTSKGLILVCVDTSNGGITAKGYHNNSRWQKWVRIYTGHFCERYAERIMKAASPKFEVGLEGIMFSDIMGLVRHTDTIASGFDEIEFQFKDGQAYGYRDSNSKIVYFKQFIQMIC